MEKKQVGFLPFHVINEFMLSPYRLSVIQWVLERQQSLSPAHGKAIHLTLKSSLKVPGFRNPIMAPLQLKVKHAEPVFERNAEFVKHVLSAWAETHPELAQTAFEFLEKRAWKVLPLDVDRARLPGILPTWPEQDDFETLTNAFLEAHPEYQAQSDDATLMLVWISNRLPVDLLDPMEWEEWDL